MAYLGQIILFAGEWVPENWARCDGTLLPIQQYQVLFTLLGTRFGGDGVTRFALPDLRGRVAVGRSAQPRGDDIIPSHVGASGGTQTVALATDQMPRHTHAFQASPDVQHTPIAPADAVAASLPNRAYFYFDPTSVATPQEPTLKASAVHDVGEDVPHDNLMPGLGLHYLICLWGDYPAPNFEMK
ncbi:phage tail protein [Aquabacter spiritensis]|uniref:Microcystin-dependent protein n=1 Tax=Aquabacter spiritensis TaxID=933073 RepID=A0A4R3M8R5_9HYPH|nr:tail fiber protein [Aquabacter spiritensis]TCT08057.1 microcystin-dependent protein [Aquabacter spiritensis]